MQLPTDVRITEVGPRDGLQNEPQNLPTAHKIDLIRQLAAAGCKEVEATAFVSPKAIPNLADAAEVMRGTAGLGITRFALIPNAKGYGRALDAGADGITLVMSATDSHNRKNLNQTVAESMAELAPLAARARDDGLAARLSISMVFGCPFEGDPGLERIRAIVDRMAGHGFTRIGLCDTIGIASPQQVHDRVSRLVQEFAGLEFELHFHDTYGRGLANVLAGLEAGVTRFDSCVGGLGGCPFAPGATGNIATEDLVSMLDASGVRTGVDLDGLLAASDFLDAQLDTRIQSNRWQVHNAQRQLRKAA
ncbi:hydroxymethylglutaryl-CoA lyase [Herbaspirillum sp. SJZ107]|uniref:hydroxymethylglutaryl-CoA lyase n=1 Tax=Herbaspirillum sp. SJZ107 TaxID=2572881 RepID=UPI00114FEF9A|nr:hydroxymethylglutaryl-CoA lyase [Herbaspirillum sp. SJZ107]TQK07742.1 hydroxymethylglutaryl-CoA lyase [Herbaspirillum sp. SJZ107]